MDKITYDKNDNIIDTDNKDKETLSSRIRTYVSGIITGMLIISVIMLAFDYFNFHPFSKLSASDSIYTRSRIVESYIDKYYWKDDITDETYADYAAKGMVSALSDRYSYYMTADEYDDAMTGVAGDYVGIGITIATEKSSGLAVIMDVSDNSPADRAGLSIHDVITDIDKVNVKKKPISDIVDLIQTGKDDTHTITIRRGMVAVSGNSIALTGDEGEKITVKVTNEEITNISVSSRMLDKDTGYIRITNFDKASVEQFSEAIKSLEKKHEKRLIVDVRDNGGGSLTAVISMLDELLPEGILLTETRKDSDDTVYRSTDDKHFDKPIAVLINKKSASASEVFAGSLSDRGAATLIGEVSFGKGIVQTIFSLKQFGAGGIKLTTGEYKLPSGRSIHEKGLTPDIEVEYTSSAADFGTNKDNVIQKAIETCNMWQ